MTRFTDLELATNIWQSFHNHRKGLTRAFPFLKVPTSAFTFLKNPLRQYAKQALKQGKYIDVKLGCQRNYHKGQAAIRIYTNVTNLAVPYVPFSCLHTMG